jgi:hypothetical protein
MLFSALLCRLGYGARNAADRGPRQNAASRRSYPPYLDVLEDRTALSTLTVVNNLDHGAGSLRAAIASAHNGDTITFASTLSGQTITLTTGELLVKQVGLTIRGPGAIGLTLSGNGASRVFEVHEPPGHPNVATTISGLTVTGGKATQGGAIFDNASVLTLNGVALVNNQAVGTPGTVGAAGAPNNPGGAGLGGGIYESGDVNGDLTSLTLTNSTIADNQAVGGPGATGANDGQALHAAGGNGGAGKGGGLYVASGTASLSNCTFAGNQAVGGAGGAGLARPTGQGAPGGAGGVGQGGALYVAVSGAGGHVATAWLTVATNKATGGAGGSGGAGRVAGPAGKAGAGTGGGLYALGSFATIDTIFALNRASTSAPDVSGAVTSYGYNLVGNTSGSQGYTSAFDQKNIDPMLGQLAYNGGSTQTMPLIAGSPAIDAGGYKAGIGIAVPPTDQRGPGFSRSAGRGFDVGAYELQG